ncbi:MAG: ABC transporter permease [Clostridia bacterium]|nr:ABC transporter permease [Clostridia bacterium]
MEKYKKYMSNEVFTIGAFMVLFLIVVIVFQSLNQSFLTPASIINMLKTVSATAIAGLGLTFVIIISHSDISFYMSCCFSAMLMAWLIQQGFHPVIAILGGLIGGIFWGLISGIAIGKFKLPDIISTIAIGSIAFGAAYIFSDGTFIYDNFMESGIRNLSEFNILGMPLPIYIMLGLYLMAYIILEKSKLGRDFYAVGANKKSAFFSGINVNRIIIAAFIVSSVLAAVSAMISTAAQGNGNVKIGLNLLMPAFTSIYIGWSVFRRPCVIGTFLGALFTTMMTNGFIIINIPFYYGDLVIALVLLFAILISKIEITSGLKLFKKQKVGGNAR